MQKLSRKSLGLWMVFFFVIAVLIVGQGIPGAYAAKKAEPLVDLNTASQKDIEGLKGVGAATAKKIIENRPYKSVDELSKAGLSAKKIEALKPFVTTGPATAAPSSAKTAAPSEKTAAKTSQGKADSLVDINTADQKSLEALPGVGSKTAQEIIKVRPFKSVDDLSKVKGITKKKMETLKGLVTASTPKAAQATAPAVPAASTKAAPATPAPAAATKAAPAAKAPAGAEKPAAQSKLAPGEKVNLNTASKEQLEKLPGIGPAKAQAIIDGRPYNAPEDVMKVKGIKEGIFNKIKDSITVK
ncbi:MAG: DNA-binding protein [Nitrospirae bacterium]|nr:MAG: DNA-binding protein [Nitrospirota bacterium]